MIDCRRRRTRARQAARVRDVRAQVVRELFFNSMKSKAFARRISADPLTCSHNRLNHFIKQHLVCLVLALFNAHERARRREKGFSYNLSIRIGRSDGNRSEAEQKAEQRNGIEQQRKKKHDDAVSHGRKRNENRSTNKASPLNRKQIERRTRRQMR